MGLATVYWLETPGPCAPGLNLACLRVKIVPPTLSRFRGLTNSQIGQHKQLGRSVLCCMQA